MKIAVAQIQPVTGDIPRNITQHLAFIEAAALEGIDVLLFPELSLTGYEPTLAGRLAIDVNDSILDDFFRISQDRPITVIVGAPTRHPEGVRISLIIFQPGKSRHIYSKRYLHPDEEPFFVKGPEDGGIIGDGIRMALAICYETAVPAHIEQAHKHRARFYLASVAKFQHGVDRAHSRLAGIARDYSMTVMMANAIGPADGSVCAGMSAIWSDEGVLLGQMDETQEGFLAFNSDTGDVWRRML